MASNLCIAICFLNPLYHGRGDRGKPEWPPSPLRLFQSMVVAATRQANGVLTSGAQTALGWLQVQTQLAPPIIVAPPAKTASSYRLYVPNNSMDLVARAWCRGNYTASGDANPARHRALKTVRPTWLLEGDTVHYLWPLLDPLPEKIRGYIEMLTDIARSVTTLGWGIDMAVGNGVILSEKQTDDLSGERWLPFHGATNESLRVPMQDTLDDLIRRHEGFLSRVGPDGRTFTAPSPLSVFEMVGYRRTIDPLRRPFAAFSLLKPNADEFRAFNTARQALTVSGMVRHAAKLAAEQSGWPEPSFILGHGEAKESGSHIAVGPRRFAYIPLPSIENRGERKTQVVGHVRRVIVTSFSDDCKAEIDWARKALSGQELLEKDEKQAVALLSLIPLTEKMVQHYTRSASTWATVTPVVLPGYDDPAHYRRRLKNGTGSEEQKQLLGRLNDRIEGLIRKAIIHTGYSKELADHAEIEWRKVGFWPGLDMADRYGVPDHLKRFPRYHVRIRWCDANGNSIQVPGPICIGGGRYYGIGLFAALPDI